MKGFLSSSGHSGESVANTVLKPAPYRGAMDALTISKKHNIPVSKELTENLLQLVYGRILLGHTGLEDKVEDILPNWTPKPSDRVARA